MRPIDLVHLPPHIEQGSAVGPSFSTSINTLASGVEQVNSNWQEELIEVNASYGMMADSDPDDLQNSFVAILSFFRARRGRYRAFLFRDPTDYYASNEPCYPVPGQLGVWQLSKTYSGYRRRITRPEAPTVVLRGPDGAPLTGWTLGALGTVTFAGAAPASFTADFYFDVPVAFANDELKVNLIHLRAGNVPSVILKQVRE